MLVKITLTLIVVYIALVIVARLYINSLNLVNRTRLFVGKNLTKFELVFVCSLGVLGVVTISMTVITIIYSIFKYL